MNNFPQPTGISRLLGKLAGILLLVAPAFAEPGIKSTIKFAGDNSLGGRILAIKPDQTLDFSSPALQGRAELKTNSLLSARLETTPPDQSIKHFVVVTVNNHYEDKHRDTIRGKLVSLSENKIVLDTAFAGRLSLDRHMILRLDFSANSPVFYQGPGKLENWTFSGGEPDDSWEQQGRFFVSHDNTGLAREVKTEKRSHISFTFDKKGRGTLRFFFFSDQGGSISPDNRYELAIINFSFLRLSRYSSAQGRTENLFNQTYTALREQDQVTIDLYLDRSGENPSALLIDGKTLHTWTEPKEGSDAFGDWFHFVPEKPTPIRLTDFTIGQWDGKLPASEKAETNEALARGKKKDGEKEESDEKKFSQLKGQHIKLKNGDTVIGKIREVSDGRLMAQTSIGDIAIPLNRAANISLEDEEKYQPRMKQHQMRAWFHTGGYLTFKLISQNGDKIRASNQVFGEAEFKLNAFSRIDFNIWRRELEAERSGNADW